MLKAIRSTLSLSCNLNKEIATRIGISLPVGGVPQTSVRDTHSVRNGGLMNLLEEQSLWNLIKSMFSHASYTLYDHWAFNQLQIVAELRITPEDYLYSVRHTLTGRMAICRILRRKIARPHRRIFEMEKKCWHRVSFCVQVCITIQQPLLLFTMLQEHYSIQLRSILLARYVLDPRCILNCIVGL